MHVRPVLPTLLVLTVLGAPGAAGAQSVVVDEGSFAITLNGTPAGTERFTIRRAGVGDDAIVIANAVIQLDRGEAMRNGAILVTGASGEREATGLRHQPLRNSDAL